MLDLRHAGPSVPKNLRPRWDLECARGLGVEDERRDDGQEVWERTEVSIGGEGVET